MRLHADVGFDVRHLNLHGPARRKLERAEHVVQLEQRLAQYAMRRVGIERHAARLAVEQDRRDHRSQVAIPARIRDAAVAATDEG